MPKDKTIDQATIDIQAEDGITSSATVFKPQEGSSAPVIICFPAMGVNARFYDLFARSLTAKGFNVVTTDLRGIGTSSVRASKKHNFGYYEMIHYDWPAVIKAVKTKFFENKIFILGHSLGGQLSSLYLSHQKEYKLSGLILITANSVYYKGYSFPDCFKVLAGTNFAFLVSQWLGYLPGHKFGFGGLEAKNVIRDWSRQGRTGRYEILNSPLDYDLLLSQLNLPVVSISFEDDFFAPSGAVRHLYKKMKNANVTHFHLSPGDHNLKNKYHFSWAKTPDFMVSMIMDWMATLDLLFDNDMLL
ncbi:MAG: alpha/beta fold hydrolase [Desulfobacteraceae bacterium]|nr:alpha/beta fold hydrolase [Desulfobacteraceae bacterium]